MWSHWDPRNLRRSATHASLWIVPATRSPETETLQFKLTRNNLWTYEPFRLMKSSRNTLHESAQLTKVMPRTMESIPSENKGTQRTCFIKSITSLPLVWRDKASSVLLKQTLFSISQATLSPSASAIPELLKEETDSRPSLSASSPPSSWTETPTCIDETTHRPTHSPRQASKEDLSLTTHLPISTQTYSKSTNNSRRSTET